MTQQISVRQSITAALFVDFQNVYRNLGDLNKRAPREFARKPERWLNWFQAGSHEKIEYGENEAPRRRILVRRVYVDDSFSQFREHFTHGAGFTIIDCPRLTGEGKNAADIRMVVDILDTLQHPTRFDEFIILSSDADFTPVLHRLRAYDRISTIVSLKSVSAALKSSCDFAVAEDTFLREALEIPSTSIPVEVTVRKEVAKTITVARPAGDATRSPATPAIVVAAAKPLVQTAATAITMLAEADKVMVDKVLRHVRARLENSAEWIHSSVLAIEIIEQIDPVIKSEKHWFGAGTFPKMIRKFADADICSAVTKAGIYLYDPKKHSLPAEETTIEPQSAVPASENGSVPLSEENAFEALCKQLGVPLLPRKTFVHALGIWAVESHNGHTLSELQKLIRDRCAADAMPINRNSISAITYFLRQVEASRSTFDNSEQVAEAICRGILRHAGANDIAISEEHNRELAALFGCQMLDGLLQINEAAIVQSNMSDGEVLQTTDHRETSVA